MRVYIIYKWYLDISWYMKSLVMMHYNKGCWDLESDVAANSYCFLLVSISPQPSRDCRTYKQSISNKKLKFAN